MRPRRPGTAPRRGWSVLAAALASAALGALLGVLNHFQPAGSVALWFDLVSSLALAVPGAALVGYRPANPIGWILAAMGLTAGASVVLGEYGYYALHTNPGSMPGGVLALWLQTLVWFPPIGLVPLLALLVPDGSPPSTRWRPLAWVAVAAMAVVIVAGAVSPGPIGGEPLPGTPQNPLGIGRARQALDLAEGVAFLVTPALAGVALLALALRFRRAQGTERQQLKWFAYGTFLLLAGGVALFLPLSEAVAKVIVAAGLGCFTATLAVAVLRHGLYEIDVIINRTLVYGLLTALLAGVYAAAVLVLGQLFGGVGEHPPSWVVAGATLAVAVLFQPARRRIQAVVDRRFNRRKYDAAKTLEAFSARLRDQVDLDTLSTELLAVTNQTMQPTMATLWLRPSGQARPRGQGHRS
jgi:MFS family permease